MHVSRRINYACRLVLPYEFLFERQFSLRSRQAEAAGFRPRRPDAGVETGPREAALQLLPGRGGAGGETVKSFLRRSSFLFSKSRLSFCRLSLVLIYEGYGRLLAVKEIRPEQAWHSVRTRQIQIASSPHPRRVSSPCAVTSASKSWCTGAGPSRTVSAASLCIESVASDQAGCAPEIIAVIKPNGVWRWFVLYIPQGSAG